MGFPGAVKTLTLSLLNATGATKRVVCSNAFVAPMWTSFGVRENRCFMESPKGATTEPLDERIEQYQSIGRMVVRNELHGMLEPLQ
jgi:hypothetical protein